QGVISLLVKDNSNFMTYFFLLLRSWILNSKISDFFLLRNLGLIIFEDEKENLLIYNSINYSSKPIRYNKVWKLSDSNYMAVLSDTIFILNSDFKAISFSNNLFTDFSEIPGREDIKFSDSKTNIKDAKEDDNEYGYYNSNQYLNLLDNEKEKTNELPKDLINIAICINTITNHYESKKIYNLGFFPQLTYPKVDHWYNRFNYENNNLMVYTLSNVLFLGKYKPQVFTIGNLKDV